MLQIDSRVRFLHKRLEDLKVVGAAGGSNQVYFGAWAALET